MVVQWYNALKRYYHSTMFKCTIFRGMSANFLCESDFIRLLLVVCWVDAEIMFIMHWYAFQIHKRVISFTKGSTFWICDKILTLNLFWLSCHCKYRRISAGIETFRITNTPRRHSDSLPVSPPLPSFTWLRNSYLPSDWLSDTLTLSDW